MKKFLALALMMIVTGCSTGTTEVITVTKTNCDIVPYIVPTVNDIKVLSDTTIKQLRVQTMILDSCKEKSEP